MRAYWVVPLIVFSQITDALSTLWVIAVLGVSAEVELNPISRLLLSSSEQFVFVKVFGALLSSLLILYANKKNPKAAKGVLFIVVSIGIVAALLNVYSVSRLLLT